MCTIIHILYLKSLHDSFVALFLFVLMLNVPVNNFSDMSGWSHRFLGITSTFKGVHESFFVSLQAFLLEYEKYCEAENVTIYNISRRNKNSAEVDIAPAFGEITTACNVGQAKKGHGACLKSGQCKFSRLEAKY